MKETLGQSASGYFLNIVGNFVKSLSTSSGMGKSQGKTVYAYPDNIDKFHLIILNNYEYY